MYVIDQAASAIYDIDKALSISVVESTAQEKLLHPAYQGNNFILKLHYSKSSGNEDVILAAYTQKDMADANFRFFNRCLGHGEPIVDFSGRGISIPADEIDERDDHDER